jgi:hypothetical protein
MTPQTESTLCVTIPFKFSDPPIAPKKRMLKKSLLILTAVSSLTMANANAGFAVVSSNGYYGAAWRQFLNADHADTVDLQAAKKQYKGGVAIAVSSNGYWVCYHSLSISKQQAEQGALDRCRKKGGINPVIRASADISRHCAVAVSGQGTSIIVGCCLGQETSAIAESGAIQDCKRRGGASPRVVQSFPTWPAYID